VEPKGFDFRDRLIQGVLCKWNAEHGWIDRDGIVLPELVLVAGIAKVIQRFQNRVCTNTIYEPLPDLDELNSQVPEAEWELDLTGKKRPPYALHHVVYLVNPVDASVYTYIGGSMGAAAAVDRLESRISMMRTMRGASVSPLVELREAPFKTRYCMKSRPEFVIRDWRDLGAPAIEEQPVTPQLPAPSKVPNKLDEYVKLVAGQAVKPVTAAEELNDEIPW
jgi:hypothetical protein